MNVLFVGGGSLGPVTPLLATATALRKMRPKARCAWVGTDTGPERALVEGARIPFTTLSVAKLPRYFDPSWIAFPIRFWRAWRDAGRILRKNRPDVVVTAGGFTAVPLVFQASRRGVPCVTHQLDLLPILTNRLIARRCVSVTTSFEYERGPFGDGVSDERIATPVRWVKKHLPSQASAKRTFGLRSNKPVVLIMGGGQGAQPLNEMVHRTKKEWLAFTQIIHLTGTGKSAGFESHPRSGYVCYELLEEKMRDAFAAADLVVCRGGMGTLSDLSALERAAIVVPMPGPHQYANTHAFEEHGAVVRMDQEEKNFDQDLTETARLLLKKPEARRMMGERAHLFLPTDDGKMLAERIVGACKSAS